VAVAQPEKEASQSWCRVGSSPGLQAGRSWPRPRPSPTLQVFLQLSVGGGKTELTVSLHEIGYSPQVREKSVPKRVPGIRRGDGALTTGGPQLSV